MSASAAGSYHPQPLETSGVEPAGGGLELTERLAENAHELWARERLAQGWTFGPKRDDEAKTHPCLIPYKDLPEEEKRFDREAAMGTVKALLALGGVVEALPKTPESDEMERLDVWKRSLNSVLNSDSGDFDMNDEPVLSGGAAEGLGQVKSMLQVFMEVVHPVWKRRDDEAKLLQDQHRSVAKWAIFPGVLAIVLGIAQLALGPGPVTYCFAALELGAALLAAFFVFKGLSNKTRDRWLAARQASERLRMLKFRALKDERLWCDLDAWKEALKSQVMLLGDLDIDEAKTWVRGGHSEPAIPEVPRCAVAATESAAIAEYYRVKRLKYQMDYFEKKAADHHHENWSHRMKFPVRLFFASVLFVMLHVLVELPDAWHHLQAPDAVHHPNVPAIVLLALAAALPVIGFSVRAWFSAFEIPRRAELFAGKAAQLNGALERVESDRFHPRKTFTHIELGEYFFENEHREWCRLMLEAEWFV